MESLLRPFVDASDVLIKCRFIVYSESKVFEVADLFNCLFWNRSATLITTIEKKKYFEVVSD